MTDQLTAPAVTRTAAQGEPDRPQWVWIRSLGYIREDGWIGGVCAAIAHRIGVDPLIVRGAFVVATLLGFPGLWLYAIAWALLPDRRGSIPLGPGRVFDPALLGVAITLVLAVAQSTMGLAIVWPILSSSPWGIGPSVLVWLLVLAAACAFVIWLARRTPPATGFPASGNDGGVSGTAAVSGGAASGAAPPHSLAATPEPIEPLPDALASAEELDAWRAQHAAWREQHDAWRVAQANGAAADEERARRRAEYAAFRAEAAKLRAERRALRPRTSIAFVVITLGAALVVATIVWMLFQQNKAAWGGYAAVLAAAAVIGLAMVIAGAMRRRSGFLAAVTVILLAIGASGVAFYLVDDMVAPNRYVPMPDGDNEIVQPWGLLTLEAGGNYDESGVTRIEKGSGSVTLIVYPGIDIDFRTTSSRGAVCVNWWNKASTESTYECLEPGDDGFRFQHDDRHTTRQRQIVLEQDDVMVEIEMQGIKR